MIPFTTLRALFRIEWVRENSEAVQILNKMFYLLIALHRSHRRQDFRRLYKIYFMMFDSFTLYGRNETKDIVDQLLQIPWFSEHKGDLYRSMVAYKRVIQSIMKGEGESPSVEIQMEINKNVTAFVMALKSLIHFDERDEARVNELLAQPAIMDNALDKIFKLLD